MWVIIILYLKLKKGGKMKNWVIVPALGEKENLPTVIDKLLNLGLDYQIVILDGGGNHIPSEIKGRMHIISVARGNGRAVKQGLHFALGAGAHFVFRVDGDGQYDPTKILEAKDLLEAGELWVLGSRFGKEANGDFPPIDRLLFHTTITPLVASLTSWPITDAITGFWGFRREFLEKILPYIKTKGYGMTIEIILRAFSLFLPPPKEIPHPRRYSGNPEFDRIYSPKNLERRLKRVQVYYTLLAKLCTELGLEGKLFSLLGRR